MHACEVRSEACHLLLHVVVAAFRDMARTASMEEVSTKLGRGGGCRAEIGENAATLEAWGLAGGLGPSKGDFQFGENTEELVSDVSEGNGGLLSGVGSRVCYAVYGPRIVCDNNNVVRDGSSVCLPVDQDELRHGSCRFNGSCRNEVSGHVCPD